MSNHVASRPQIGKSQQPFSMAWQISLKSIRIRLGRSMITASGILLGIAFYSSVRTTGLFDSGKTDLPAMHRQQWLAIMALLVCFVGIMNAMLMSVTERFKEIGTMKCLGASDRFIVMLFFIEAVLMGLIASFLGWLVGWSIIALLHVFSDGIKVFTAAAIQGSLVQCIQSLLIGSAITLIAAIPPAVNAAHMPPANALRTEI